MDAKAAVFEALAEAFTPEPVMSVSHWAETYRMLSQKASSEPGRWRNTRTPYLNEIMDELGVTSPTKRVVFMKGAQLGGTECGNNWIGYVIHHCPAPILMVQPTVDTARRTSKQRLAPMIEATEVLARRISQPRARDSGNTTFMKEFPGGLLILTGANSAAGLRSMPIRFLFLDEVDEYPGDVDGQGDPVALAEKRTSTFARRKVFLVSTPTVKDFSRIEREYLDSDQRHYYVPCPECEHMDWMRWENIRWDEGKPETAELTCAACGCFIGERYKSQMLSRGEWRAAKPGARSAGFHLSALYSPLGWKSWAECAQEFVTARDNPFLLKTWVNTTLGETWEERGSTVEPSDLLRRVEAYPDGVEVPHGVGALVASVDVQDDRLEVKVKGYGAAEESWLVALTQLHGDPSDDELWQELDRFLRRKFRHESGRMMPIQCVAIDSGGHYTENVYKFCKLRQHRRIFAIKGGQLQGAPVIARPTMSNRYRCKLFVLCVDTAKEVVLGRMRVTTPGPGYMHLPANIVDEEYVSQLTAEKALRKYVRGRGSVKEWVKIRERNEAFDLEVYALAALYIPGPDFVRDLKRRAALWSQPAADGGPGPGPPDADAQPAAPGASRDLMRFRQRPTSWTNRWKK